jgi:hypothetical protein
MLTGKDYPHLCSACRSAIDDMAGLYADDLMEDTDNEEAACDAVYDHRMFCGGGECINKPIPKYVHAPYCPGPMMCNCYPTR